MKVLTAEDLGIEILEGVHDAALQSRHPFHQLLSAHSLPRLQQEAFIRERFGIKLEDPRTGRWIRSWCTDGE